MVKKSHESEGLSPWSKNPMKVKGENPIEVKATNPMKVKGRPFQ
jgi:hypothetical protein